MNIPCLEVSVCPGLKAGERREGEASEGGGGSGGR